MQGFMFLLAIMLLASIFLYTNPDVEVDLNKITGAGVITEGFALKLMPGQIYGEQACRPPANGDWIVNKRIVCKDTTVKVAGNLIFENDGELIFFNSRYINIVTGDNMSGYFRLANLK